MTHVRILKNEDGTARLLVDEMDLSFHVGAGMNIEYRDDADYPTLVHITLIADKLTVA